MEQKVYTYDEAFKASLEYFGGDELAARVWVNKYAMKDSHGNIYEQSPTDMHWRLAREIARIEQKYANPVSAEEIFTLLDRETIESLIARHEEAPHLRELQKTLAKEITTMIHSAEEYEKAVEASQILFGGATSEALHKLDEQTLLQVFEGVPQFTISKEQLGCSFVDLCADLTKVFPSKGECRKMVQGGGVSLNKEKVADPMRAVTEADLIAGKYMIAQRGKKNYYLIIVE